MGIKRDFCLCRNIDCPRNAECGRYIEEAEYDDQYYCMAQFENICFEKNNYAYFVRKDWLALTNTN